MEDGVYKKSLKLFVTHTINHSCACENSEMCQQGLEKTLETSMNAGYMGIRIFPIEGLIDTLADRSNGNPDKVIGDSITAVRVLLTYGTNICRNPQRPEFQVIKTYTGFFESNIMEKFPEYPLVLTGFGYSEGEYSDELQLFSIPKNVNEFAFGVLLTVMELRRIQNLVRIAVELKGTLADALNARKQVQSGGKWRFQDAVVYLINNKRIERSDGDSVLPATNANQVSATNKLESKDDIHSSFEDLVPVGPCRVVRHTTDSQSSQPDIDDIYSDIEGQGTSLQHLDELSLRRYSDAGNVQHSKPQTADQSRQDDVINRLNKNYNEVHVPDIYKQ